MMKKIFFLMIILACISSVNMLQAQNVMETIYPKEHVINRKPIPYPYVREGDVMWSKTIWRVIDLREKMNLPLYYPLKKMDGRYSLGGLLFEGIRKGDLTAYSTKGEDEFETPITYDQVLEEMDALADTVSVKQADGTFKNQVIEGEIHPDEIKQIMVKEVWFFDRKYSILSVRVLGLCPIREYTKEGGDGNRVVRKATFWIYFPQARDLLCRYEVFNVKNDAERRSFDDIFIKRYFSSYIVKESNVYNNRGIADYANGLEAMLESQRVKEQIFNFEQDLWEY